MLENLKQAVLRANLSLVEYGLVSFTWGNASGIDRERGLIVIKPSGVEYDGMTAEDMVVVDMDGKVVEGQYRPSSDTPTHIELYRAFPDIGGVVHTHSMYATAFAQSGRPIKAYGTTHADHFCGEIPCTRELTADEIAGEYEKKTGAVIAERFSSLDPNAIPACLVSHHGPFTWGADCQKAAMNAAVLELVAECALLTESLNPNADAVSDMLLHRHFYRKHGKNAYYGQERQQ